ncbi:UPF0016-domain-containing protein [Mytilinidion resinicola]|uniref:UPF0016-domain-containing protein n=1 Tax=Mytilinidion resinicola TaxID=574789 RepID=A0A6A6Y6P3_9PEZI|nr:UPF0016-domain-containing protein [Mytilinidion resinicola]KAF2803865.1 UPF0016-domain-containing protein [Mytilinidion resinicola]
MRLRRRPAPLFLLLLPTLPVFASALPKDTDGKQVARDAKVQEYAAIPTIAPGSPGKLDIGTEDAPVDGLDGKPHAGPFVDGKQKKPPAEVEDLLPVGTKLPDPKKKTQDLTKEEVAALKEEDGVMNDKNRATPKDGTDGTKDGVSAKTRERKEEEERTGEKAEKKPDPPKEAPPQPHDGKKKIKDKLTADSTSTKKPGAVGFEKPTDLPETPHDIPHPAPPTSNDDPLDIPTKKPSDNGPSFEDEDPSGVIQPLHSFLLSLTMILFSEVGDKTFLIAALMAMRHPRALVFSAAFAALITMTVLSAVLGHAVPTLLPKRFTNFAAAILFLVFGAKMLREGLAMSPEEGVGEEMKEVEMELEEKEQSARRNSRRRSSISPYVLEAGRARRSRSGSRLPAPARSPSSSPSRSRSPNTSSLSAVTSGLTNLFSLLLSPAWVQTFVMTFLGEWGDRSQIATIAMAAGQDYWWVTGGAISGHAVCTGVAVLGGRAIAGKVSMRVVTLGGAIAFLVFGVIYLIEALYSG